MLLINKKISLFSEVKTMTTTKISYTQQGDYLLPDLKLPKQPKVEIGVFGKRRLRYLEHNRKILYTSLLTKGNLTAGALAPRGFSGGL